MGPGPGHRPGLPGVRQLRLPNTGPGLDRRGTRTRRAGGPGAGSESPGPGPSDNAGCTGSHRRSHPPPLPGGAPAAAGRGHRSTDPGPSRAAWPRPPAGTGAIRVRDPDRIPGPAESGRLRFSGRFSGWPWQARKTRNLNSESDFLPPWNPAVTAGHASDDATRLAMRMSSSYPGQASDWPGPGPMTLRPPSWPGLRVTPASWTMDTGRPVPMHFEY
jgi:hypothetical protein